MVFSWSRYRDEGAHRSNWSNTTSIEAPDANTVVVTLGEPQPDFIAPISGSFSTIHPRELVDAGEIETKAIGTGPGILDFWTNGEGGAFDRKPGLRARRRQDRPLGASLRAGRRGGEGAVPRRQPRLRPQRSDRRRARGDSRDEPGRAVLRPAAVRVDVCAELQHGPGALDRRADSGRGLSLAYDRQELLDIIYDGVGVVLPQMDWRYFWDDAPQLGDEVLGNWWRFDPDEARKLLDAAGASDIAFDLMFYNYSPTSNSSQNEVLLAQYQSQGINMSLQSVDYSEYNSQWTTRSGETDSYQGWASFEATGQHYVYGLNHSASTGNRNRVNDAQIDEWADQYPRRAGRGSAPGAGAQRLEPNAGPGLPDRDGEREHGTAAAARGCAGFATRARSAAVTSTLDTGYEMTNAWLDK